MKRCCAVLVALSLAFTLGVGTAQANFFASYGGDFTLVYGGDGLGLSGATFNLSMEFVGPQNYVNAFGLPWIGSVDHSLTISGASQGSSNGTFTEADEMGFYPTFPGQYFGGGQNIDGFAEFYLGGGRLDLIRLTGEVSGINIGDPVEIGDFGTTLFNSGYHWVGATDASQYRIDNFSATVNTGAVIPEPATLLIIALGGAVAAGGRLRRRIRG